MDFSRNVFVQIEHFNWNNFALAKEISKKLGNGLYVVLVDFDQQEQDKVIKRLKEIDASIHINTFSSLGEAKTFIDDFKPTLVMVTQEKVNPLIHVFKLTEAEKFVKGLNDFNILLLWEETQQIEKVLINLDYETTTEEYIKLAYEFASKISKEFDFIYSFYESFYENRLRKTHADEEAKKILIEMFEEHVHTLEEKIEKALGKKMGLKVVKGDPKKEVPYYSRTHNYDLLVINQSIEDKESYIENTENSVAILLD